MQPPFLVPRFLASRSYLEGGSKVETKRTSSGSSSPRFPRPPVSVFCTPEAFRQGRPPRRRVQAWKNLPLCRLQLVFRLSSMIIIHIHASPYTVNSAIRMALDIASHVSEARIFKSAG